MAQMKSAAQPLMGALQPVHVMWVNPPVQWMTNAREISNAAQMEFAAPQLRDALPVVPVMMERRGVSRLRTAEAPGVDWTECAALQTAALPSVNALWASLAAVWMKTAEET